MLRGMTDTQTIERTRPKLSRGSNNDAHRIGPFSRPHKLAKVDGRTSHAAVMRRVRAELTAHVGGHPTAIQRALIERIVWLSLKLAMLDEKLATGKDFTEVDSNTYLAWNNSCVRTLARLNETSRRSSTRKPLAAILAEKRAG
jgi:hypothetical protein